MLVDGEGHKSYRYPRLEIEIAVLVTSMSSIHCCQFVEDLLAQKEILVAHS
jgi:hypothetical protein